MLFYVRTLSIPYTLNEASSRAPSRLSQGMLVLMAPCIYRGTGDILLYEVPGACCSVRPPHGSSSLPAPSCFHALHKQKMPGRIIIFKMKLLNPEDFILNALLAHFPLWKANCHVDQKIY